MVGRIETLRDERIGGRPALSLATGDLPAAAVPHARAVATLRHAVPQDRGRVKDIEDAAFRWDRLSRRSIARAITSPSQSVIVAADLFGAVVAAAFVHYRRRSPRARLHSIAVAAACERRGLGSRLLAACEQDAWRRGCRELRLEVRRDHRCAIHFYERNGYCRVGVQAGFYEDGGDAICFTKYRPGASPGH